MRRRNSGSPRKLYNLGGRYLTFIVIVRAMFVYLCSGVFNLQLVDTETYAESAENRRTKTITLRGSRGMITDSDAVILARDEFVLLLLFRVLF